jgi:hypothetical protein
VDPEYSRQDRSGQVSGELEQRDGLGLAGGAPRLPPGTCRTFGETRRRVKVIGRLPGEHACLSLVWAVLDRASAGWRGFTMTPAGLRRLQDLRRQLLDPPAWLHCGGPPGEKAAPGQGAAVA